MSSLQDRYRVVHYKPSLETMRVLQGDLNLNICEAHAFNTHDRFSLDVFVVHGWSGQVHMLLGLAFAGICACCLASSVQICPQAHRDNLLGAGYTGSGGGTQ